MKVKVENGKVTVTEIDRMPGGSLNYYTAEFEIGSEYDGMEKIAAFSNQNESINVYLDDTNTCKIPYEVIRNGSELTVGFYAVLPDKTITATPSSTVRIDNGTVPAIVEAEPTMNAYAQMLEMSKETLSEASGYADNAGESAQSASDYAEEAQLFAEESRKATEDAINYVEEFFEARNTHELKMSWESGVASSIAHGVLYPDNTQSATEPMLLPKGGIYVYYGKEARPNFRTNFYRNVDGEYVNATDYEAYVSNDGRDKIPIYYPYAEGVYFSVTVEANPYDGEIVVYGGESASGERLPFIAGGWVSYTDHLEIGGMCYPKDHSQPMEEYETKKGFNYGVFASYIRTYVTVLPLKLTKSISCSPKYSMVAQIYKVDKNAKTTTHTADIFNTDARYVNGFCRIDLEQYDYDGYALVAIFCTSRRYGHQDIRRDTMGMLARYDDVMDNVSVEWSKRARVEYESALPQIARENIKSVMDVKVDLKSHFWGDWTIDYVNAIPEMKQSNPFFYTTGGAGNNPIMGVSPKSIASAAKNPNGRFYKYEGRTGDGRNSREYGITCSEIVTFALGLPTTLSNVRVYLGLDPNFEVRNIRTIEDVKVGDCLLYWEGQPDYGNGHICYVNDVVKIDGAVYAINVFEGAQPTMRFRPFINYEAFGWEDFTGLMYMYSSKEFEGRGYNKAARYIGELNTFRDAYGEYVIPESEEKTIMCDRGTDSVYCIGQECYLTVTDNSISSIDIYVDGSLAHSNVSLNSLPHASVNYSEANYLKAIPDVPTHPYDEYDIGDYLTVSGMYEIKVSGETIESFYVPPNQVAYRTDESDTHYRITHTPTDDVDVIGVTVLYKRSTDTVSKSFVYYGDEIVKTENESYTIVPKRFTANGEEWKYSYFRVHYKCEYGAFGLMYEGANFPKNWQRSDNDFFIRNEKYANPTFSSTTSVQGVGASSGYTQLAVANNKATITQKKIQTSIMQSGLSLTSISLPSQAVPYCSVIVTASKDMNIDIYLRAAGTYARTSTITTGYHIPANTPTVVSARGTVVGVTTTDLIIQPASDSYMAIGDTLTIEKCYVSDLKTSGAVSLSDDTIHRLFKLAWGVE